MNRYYSQKDVKVGAAYAATVLLTWSILLIPLVRDETDKTLYIILTIIAGVITFFILDVWTFTYYQIDQDNLTWHSGHLFHGTVAISSIRHISYDKNVLTVNGMYKPSLSFKNMTIGYHTYDELLIAPKNEHEFIQELFRINPGIEVRLPLQTAN